MTTKKNDTAIMKLKKAVDVKRAALKTAQRFTPVTNCSLLLFGSRMNIQAMGKTQLTEVLVTLNAYLLSAKDLKLSYVIEGFDVEDWIIDLQAKLAYINRAEASRQLKVMEDKLELLLSSEKQVELKVDALAAEIEKM